MPFYVYMLKTISKNKKKTYVGYTNNLKARIDKHNSNKGAKSTKGYKWILIFKKKPGISISPNFAWTQSVIFLKFRI